MYLQRLKTYQYRNLADTERIFKNGVYFVIGNNGRGKTNFLEAIYILGFGKTFQSQRITDAVQWETDAFFSGGSFSNGIEMEVQIGCTIHGEKTLRCNNRIVKRQELIGTVKMVLLLPTDHELVSGGPALRRKYLDVLLSQTDTRYLNSIIRYTHGLKQRNAALKQIVSNGWPENILDPLDERLSNDGSLIIQRRKKWFETMKPIIADLSKQLFDTETTIECIYQPSICTENDTADAYHESLQQSRARDIQYMTTSIGIHRDEIDIFMNNRLCRKVGSNGQQRMASLLLRCCEIYYIRSVCTAQPIILMDDVLLELDTDNRLKINELIQSLCNDGMQLFACATEESILNKLNAEEVIYI